MSSPTKPVTSWGLRPPSRQNQYSPSRASNPQTMLSTPSGLRPASRQEQYLPTLSRAYNSPSSNQSSQANPKMQPTLVPFTLKNGSTASLAPKPSLPEHAQQNGRRRAQSFSLQKPAPTSNPNKSWPQLSVERDNREQAPLRRRQILFYDRQHPYYEFTNFSEHPVKYKGKKYPTSEHLFQSFKFQDNRPGLAEHIRLYCPRPSDALSEARRFQPEVRRDWMQVNVKKMDETLWYKFTQHSDLKRMLLSTGNAELIEDSDKDSFWGVGADGRGRNELGKALERLRTKLRKQ